MDKESKKERFIRIAESRTNKIIDMIDLLGNCSNKHNYDYSQEDIKKIFDAIEQKLKVTKSKFEMEESNKQRFTLKD